MDVDHPCVRKKPHEPPAEEERAAGALDPDAATEALAQPLEHERVRVVQRGHGPPAHDRPQLFEELFVVGRQVRQAHARDGRDVARGIARPRGVERVEDAVPVAGQHGLEARAVAAAYLPQGLAAQALPDQGLHAQRNEEFRQAQDVRMGIQDFRHHRGTATPGGKNKHRGNPVQAAPCGL